MYWDHPIVFHAHLCSNKFKAFDEKLFIHNLIVKQCPMKSAILDFWSTQKMKMTNSRTVSNRFLMLDQMDCVKIKRNNKTFIVNLFYAFLHHVWLLLITLKCQILSLFWRKADKRLSHIRTRFSLSNTGHDLIFDFQRLVGMKLSLLFSSVKS